VDHYELLTSVRSGGCCDRGVAWYRALPRAKQETRSVRGWIAAGLYCAEHKKSALANVVRFLSEAPEGASFDVVSNPEFLREGKGVVDTLEPQRIVVGATGERAFAVLREVYAPIVAATGAPVVETDVATAELIKYAANAFLATKISFINEMANLAEAVGADVHDVAKAMGLDRRIGPKFLHPGPGYGGSCLPKDTRALRDFAHRAGVEVRVVEASIDANDNQARVALRKVTESLKGRGTRTVAILGLSYKPDTDDLREAPSLELIRSLKRRGVKIRVYDPVVRETTPGAPTGVTFAASAYEAVKGADAMALVTEWNEFRKLDLAKVRRAMRRRVIVDLRNVYDPVAVRRLGFEYTCVGRPK
jgi:UDPglucose 6-dehydrogenase